MLAGYDQLLAAARRLQWHAEAIDLRPDAARAPELDAATAATLAELVAGFHLAEHAVAAELAPYVAAAGDSAAAECFAVQAGDEGRHARFFDRVAGEVLPIDDTNGLTPPGIRELFVDILPATARTLAADDGELPAAVGLYHLVLEGIVFAVGQEALLALARDHGLTGVADGVARVQGDERWHIGLGVLALQRLGTAVDVDQHTRRALAAWGPRIATPERVERTLAVHARRCAIAAQQDAATR